VVVTESVVRVEQGTKQPPAQLGAGAIENTTDAGAQSQKKPLAAAEEQLSCRIGYLVFHETALVDAIAEFNRYNDRAMVIDDSPSLDAVHVGGTFRSMNVDAFVRFLEAGFDMETTRTGEEIQLR